MDPYKVLGISRDASDEEVKKAYHELARKYHPDNYVNNPLSDLVEEKMKQINEAYEMIQKERAGRGAQNAGASANPGAGSKDAYDGDPILFRVRELMRSSRFAEAELVLDSMPPEHRGAEWNYLKGLILSERGWLFDAQKHLETACYMDPGSMEYRGALEQLRNRSANFGTGYRTVRSGSECSGCDICSSLLCADCLCESLGGDLIRCC